MKTKNLILTLALAIGIFAFSNVNAIDPISFSTDKAVSKTEMIVEKDIKVQDWMVDADLLVARNGVAKEKSLKVENWMLEGSWNKTEGTTASAEPALKLESWMLTSFTPEEESAQ